VNSAFYLVGCAGLITSRSTLNIQRQLQPAEQEPKLKQANQIHSNARIQPAAAPRVQTKHAPLPHLDKPSTKPQGSSTRHGDEQEERGKRASKSRRKKVSWVDDTDYDYLEPGTRPPRYIAQNNGMKKELEIMDVDGDSSEDDWLPCKAPPAKRKRKAK